MNDRVVTREIHGQVLVLTADFPPVNALGHPVRAGLLAAVEDAANDDAVDAVVLICAGRTFFAGADISEFGKPRAEPTLSRVCAAIEACPKPVVAAMHGTALGGGLEIALACHYRIAVPSARFGLPEVKIGLLPGAGGTQRLPRLIGVATAIELIVSAEQIGENRAASIGLIDRTADEGKLLQGAIDLASEKAYVRPIPRICERANPTDGGAIERFVAANGRKIRGLDAPNAALRAVRAATELEFGDGLLVERRLFTELEAGEQSGALRYFFNAERGAGRVDDLAQGAAALPVRKIGIVGAGTMGAGIATAFLSSGFPVVLYELNRDALDRGLQVVRGNLSRAAASSRLGEHETEAALAAVTPVLEPEALGDCDVVIEAAFELMEIKRKIFGMLDRVAKPEAILATNTSYLDIDEIAAATTRPDRVMGLHFFSPAHIMKLLEVVRGARTSSSALLTAMALAKRIGKTAVIAGNGYGFIGNRILARRRTEALNLLMEGAFPDQIDAAHVAFGMPMGPFQMSDLAGVDIGWHRDPSRIESLRDALCAAGRFGQKAGKGFYDYDDHRTGSPSREAQAIIRDYAMALGRPQRAISEEEILERTLYPMVDEGARIVAEGIARKTSDVDVVWVRGFGWPIYRGGPMYWADHVGLKKIVSRLRHYGLDVAPSLEARAESGRSLLDPAASG